jgi:hypothetical protein
MEPNHGVAVGDLRVLLVSTSTGQQRWYWWLVSLATDLQGDAERHQHEVRVLSRSTQTLLAVRTFDQKGQAERVRERFVGLVSQGRVDPADPAAVQALLDKVSVG